MRSVGRLLVCTVLLGSAACGERLPLGLLDAGGATPSFVSDGTVPTSATFACAGAPQLEVAGEVRELDHMTASVSYHEYRGAWLLHLDWCTSQYGGWGIFVDLSQVPRGKRVDLGAPPAPQPELHAFFGGGPGLPAGSTGREAQYAGTLLVDGDLPRLRVEVCLEATILPTPYDREQMVLRMYYTGRVGGQARRRVLVNEGDIVSRTICDANGERKSSAVCERHDLRRIAGTALSDAGPLWGPCGRNVGGAPSPRENLPLRAAPRDDFEMI